MVFITGPTQKEMKRIGRILLEDRLIACLSIIKDIDSRFWWKGKVESKRECLLVVKTTRTLLKKLIKTTLSEHPYDVPEIIAIPIVAGHKDYLDWIRESTQKKTSPETYP
jgi:periplasmic divalent cation tolerance protein